MREQQREQPESDRRTSGAGGTARHARPSYGGGPNGRNTLPGSAFVWEGRPSSPWTLTRLLWPYRGRALAVLGLLFAGALLGLANPWLARTLLQDVLLARRAELLLPILGLFLLFALVRTGLGLVQGQLYTALAGRVLLDLRRRFLARLERQPLSYLARERYGELVVRSNRDLAQVQEFATGTLLSLATSMPMLLGSAILGWSIAPGLFALALAPLPLALVCVRLFRGRLRARTLASRECSAELGQVWNEAIVGARTLREFGREAGMRGRFVQRAHALLRAQLALQWTGALAGGLPRLCLSLSGALVLWRGGLAVIAGELQPGSLLALGMYVSLCFGPLASLVEFSNQWTQTRVSLERVSAWIDTRERRQGPAEGRLDGAIEFSGLRFRHDPQTALLEGLDGRIGAGEHVLLVGPSGSGKSTLADLVLGLLEPQSGEVRIGGRAAREISSGSLRASIAAVAQDTFLFHDSIEANLRLGAPHASSAELEAACSAVGLIDALREHGADLQTVVGERGLRLSGGERQRVAIARALLARPRILILDEATSWLDRESERRVRAGIRGHARDATILEISHRGADPASRLRVFTLQEGRIQEPAR